MTLEGGPAPGLLQSRMALVGERNQKLGTIRSAITDFDRNVRSNPESV